jgi:hypothetical protein
MTDVESQRLTELENRVLKLEQQAKALARIEIAPESGGGRATYGPDNVVLRLDALTPTSART